MRSRRNCERKNKCMTQFDLDISRRKLYLSLFWHPHMCQRKVELLGYYLDYYYCYTK